jgi:maltose O-acetyltransferase
MRDHLRSIVVNVVAATYGVPVGLRRRLLQLCGMAVGSRTTIRSRCTFPGTVGVSIGQDCYISYQCLFDASAPIMIHDGVYIAHQVNIVTSTHAIGDSSRRASLPQLRQPVTIGRGCWLGTGVIVLPGVTVGEGCVIAAGAVVAADCAPDGLYAGVPARRLRDLSTDSRH